MNDNRKRSRETQPKKEAQCFRCPKKGHYAEDYRSTFSKETQQANRGERKRTRRQLSLRTIIVLSEEDHRFWSIPS